MSDHTPGPWHAGETLDVFAECQDDGEDPIASIHERSSHNDCFAPEARANARLIAAAPDLLERLNSVTDALEALTKDAAALGLDQETCFNLCMEITQAREIAKKVEEDPEDEE